MASTYPIEERSIAELSADMAEGRVKSEELVALYLERIATLDKQGPKLNSVLEVNPDALFIAGALDRERSLSGPRGTLHGIPVLLKDNIDTGDKMHTSAGSLALANSISPRDSFVAQRLRAAGAVILGNANMTEWANFMTQGMPSGYSSRGGQVLNPYLPESHTPGGSSSGPGAAVAANLCSVAVGTETSGSILNPASNNSVVGIKPTVGLVSRTGIIPIAFSQDTAGPLARTVADAAAVLNALVGIDPSDPATAAAAGRIPGDYRQFLDRGGLKGARIGIVQGEELAELSADERQLFEAAIAALRDEGAQVDWVDGSKWQYWRSNVLTYEFKAALNAYLASLGPGAPVRSLSEVIAFNDADPARMLKYGQTWLLEAEATSGTLTEPEYLLDRLKDLRIAREEAINPLLEQGRLDALLLPKSLGCWMPAKAGYPSICVPAGYTGSGVPFGITLTGKAWSEPMLIRLGYAFEQATGHRRPPRLS